jgi:hypothetical protein
MDATVVFYIIAHNIIIVHTVMVVIEEVLDTKRKKVINKG